MHENSVLKKPILHTSSMVIFCVAVQFLFSFSIFTGCSESSLDALAPTSSAPPPFEPAGPDSAPNPMETGPFPVGVKTYDFFDKSRPDPETGKPRFLRVEIWYPAVQSAAGGPSHAYDLKEEADENIDLGEAYDDFMAAEIGVFESLALRDAELERDYGPYPIIFFSHGAFSLRFQYLFYTVHLASHGHIVVAPDHEGNTLWDMIRDGFDPNVFGASAEKRPYDIIFLINRMEKFNGKPGHFFNNAFDINHIVVTGHSFGGFTAAAVPCLDSRPSLAVPLTPLLQIVQAFGCEFGDYPVPIMIMGGTKDQTISWKSQYCYYRSVGGVEKYLYEFVGGGHFTFSDLCGLDIDMAAFGDGPDIQNDGCSKSENAPYQDGHKTIRHYATALFNYRLRGSVKSASYLIDGGAPPFDTVNFYKGDELSDWSDGGCGSE